MKTRTLFITTDALEIATGLALVVVPDTVMPLLLGTTLDAPAALVVARIAGAALISLGLACWLARKDELGRTAKGLVAAILAYNIIAVATLAYAGSSQGIGGMGLWPAVVLHLAMAAWCIVCLRPHDTSTTNI
jgi:hypothetical protein